MLLVGIIICAVLIVVVFLATPHEDVCNMIPQEELRNFESKIKKSLKDEEEGSYTFELECEEDYGDIVLDCLVQQKGLFEDCVDVHSYWFQLRYGGGYEMVVNWTPETNR